MSASCQKLTSPTIHCLLEIAQLRFAFGGNANKSVGSSHGRSFGALGHGLYE
jgi:hypothetical protein